MEPKQQSMEYIFYDVLFLISLEEALKIIEVVDSILNFSEVRKHISRDSRDEGSRVVIIRIHYSRKNNRYFLFIVFAVPLEMRNNSPTNGYCTTISR